SGARESTAVERCYASTVLPLLITVTPRDFTLASNDTTLPSFHKAKEANWDKVMKVHLKGTFCCTQPVFKWMRDNGGGVIVNT
ncbi:SDR family NAD(P)-dependent oxidoreductase, partial [Bradyrhizobium brasilense]|uniref:SDR family NAD(P)-dependent oxidoreductase n=1 Tax=Bradyrhizobium brasilense TaxID=1419277 RepID=UPI0014568869